MIRTWNILKEETSSPTHALLQITTSIKAVQCGKWDVFEEACSNHQRLQRTAAEYAFFTKKLFFFRIDIEIIEIEHIDHRRPMPPLQPPSHRYHPLTWSTCLHRLPPHPICHRTAAAYLLAFVLLTKTKTKTQRKRNEVETKTQRDEFRRLQNFIKLQRRSRG